MCAISTCCLNGNALSSSHGLELGQGRDISFDHVEKVSP